MKFILKKKSKTQHQIPIGEHTIELNLKGFWLFEREGKVVVAITFLQEKERYKNLALILETGETIPFEWENRRAKKIEVAGFKRGVHPMLKAGSLTPMDIPQDVANSVTLRTALEKKEHFPIGGFFWQSLDCGMEEDPSRASAARMVAAIKETTETEAHWNAYSAYKSLVPTDALSGLTWEEFLRVQEDLEVKRFRYLQSKPEGTDGWR